ncbi:hypothetical protein D3C87_2117530 [compost metagenome]
MQLHSMKGAFMMIREPNVVAACIKLEAIAKENDLPTSFQLFVDLEELVKNTLSTLAPGLHH